MLLPLWDVEGARRVCEDVRDAEVCVALVGDFLRAAEEQGFEGCFEGGATVSETGTGGTGGGGCASGGRVAVALARRIPCFVFPWQSRNLNRNYGSWLTLVAIFASEILRFAQDDTFKESG